MILVQKQPSMLPSMSSISHRRHPSAPPAVIVQPTKTPGLLSVYKPLRPSTPRQHSQPPPRQQRATPRSKSTVGSVGRAAQPLQAQVQPRHDESTAAATLTPVSNFMSAGAAAQVPGKKMTPVTSPEKSTRGRQHMKPIKDKGLRRSASHSTVRASARRHHPHHQPSPPAPDLIPSQAEVPKANSSTPRISFTDRSSSNSFDPFLISDDSDTPGTDANVRPARSSPAARPIQPGVVRPIPTLSDRPSGKLARRRQPTYRSESPTPNSKRKAKAVPVPRLATASRDGRDLSTNHLSRSEPFSKPFSGASRPTAKRASTTPIDTLGLPDWDAFPVCDDTDDMDDTTPSTPVRDGVTWQKNVLTSDDGPRTAPLSSKSGWPFDRVGPLSTPKRERPRYHQRAPSEGVFNMSSDDEAPSVSSYIDDKAGKAMASLLKRQSLPVRSGLGRGGRGSDVDAEEKAPYFASSMFQNSPSPEDLPIPTFTLRF